MFEKINRVVVSLMRVTGAILFLLGAFLATASTVSPGTIIEAMVGGIGLMVMANKT